MVRPKKILREILRDSIVALAIFGLMILWGLHDANAAVRGAQQATAELPLPISIMAKSANSPRMQRKAAQLNLKNPLTGDVRLTRTSKLSLPTSGTYENRLIVIGIVGLFFASMCTLTMSLWRQMRRDYARQRIKQHSGDFDGL